MLMVNLLGLALIALTLWWFFFSKPPAQILSGLIDILVKDGVYEPASIQVPSRTAIRLRFLRQDPTPCAEVVVFSKLNRSYLLPLNQVVEVELDPQPVGELEFCCQMGMYRGRVVIS